MSDKEITKLPSSQILVRQGRVTLIWPLTLHMKEPPRTGSIVEATSMGFAADLAEKFQAARKAGRVDRCWVPVLDPMEHIARPERLAGESDNAFRIRQEIWENEAYAEAVYFHEFIQAFLYREPDGKDEPPFRLFRRTDVRHARLRFNRMVDKAVDKTVDVERVNLYIFRTGVAVFTMDMIVPVTDGKSATSGWTLAEFQTFHDLVRRAYAPFFIMNDDGRRVNGSLVLDSIQWLDKDRHILCGPDGKGWTFDLRGDMEEAPRYVGSDRHKASRYPPLFRHWRVLLETDLPLADYSPHRPPITVTDGSAAAGRWHHVVDERMATLATVSVADSNGGSSRYRRISDGDMVRLCFADSAGTDEFPYDKDFLKDFDEGFTYDRFRSSGTRFLISGYSFVALLGTGFGDAVISTHMRRHYFQMMLLAQMELASLLGFSGQVSRAVQRYGSGRENRENLEKCMSAIQEEFLQFVHRFRFTGVSNQLQAQELFELLRKNLKSQELFDDVQDEIAVANDFLRAEASDRATRSAEWLSLLGGIAVVLGVVIGLLSTNFIADAEVWRAYFNGLEVKPKSSETSELWQSLGPDLIIVSAVTGIVGLISLVFVLGKRRSLSSPILKPFLAVSGVCAAVGLYALVKLL